MTSSKLGFVSVFALVSLSALAFAAACGDRKFDGGDDDSQGNGGAGGEGSSSGGSGNTSGELRISGELRNARFNVAYRATLDVEGEEGDVEFELTDGDLPRGVTLSSDGVLSGKPTEEGVFEFTVVARDADGNAGTVDLTLRVVRHSWLVFLADEEASGQSSLYAVDTSKSQLTTKRLNPELVAEESIAWSAFRFSANGESLAFTVEAADDRVRLYVVEFSEDGPSEARLVPMVSTASVGGFALTPDGDAIAFHQTADDGSSWGLFYLELDDLEADPVVIDSASSGYAVDWLTDERVVYGSGDGNATRSLDGAEFSAATPLNFGSTEAMHRPTERILFTQAATTCAKRGWLYDFLDAGRESAAPAAQQYYWPTYDAKLTRVTHSDGNSGALVFDAMKTNGEPLGLVSPANACENVYWSPNGSRVVMWNTASPARFVASSISERSFESETITGDYEFPNYGQGGFIDADRFVFGADNKIMQANLGASELFEAHALFDSAEDSPALSSLSIAPDGSWVFFFGVADAAGTPGPFALDMRGSEAGTPRRLVTSNVGSLTVGSRYFETPTSAPSWSPDSSRLAFVLAGSGSPSASRLFIADLLHDTALAVRVSGGTCYSGDPVRCQQVTSMLFQP